ncbi:SCP2 domain-containing protein [Marinicella sp. W31]|uniref:ubiquinone biosynthesis accessory factor UbiJ n=1 Tax=Marinicella sp. W31 TaxID=3023713 RepID=UPI0037568B05
MSETEPLLKKAINTSLHRAISLDPKSQKQLSAFAGKVVQLNIKPIDKSVFIEIGEEQLLLSKQHQKTPDTVIEGTPTGLFAMASGQHISGLDSVIINGDASAGQFIADWLKNFKPDWEEALCLLFGDGPGVRMAHMLRGGFDFAQRLGQSLLRSSQEYLLEESSDLIHPHEMEQFLDDVDDLKSDTDVLTQKINRLRERKS